MIKKIFISPMYIGEISELITNNITGILISPNKSDELLKSINDLLENK